MGDDESVKCKAGLRVADSRPRNKTAKCRNRRRRNQGEFARRNNFIS